VYLIHFDRRYKHAGHYIGWARDLLRRLAEHARGQGARLMAVITEAGIGWRLARTWSGGRARERQIKKQGGASRRCPLCGVRPRIPSGPLPAVAFTAQSVVTPTVPALPRPSPAEQGARMARLLIARQIAAGQSPDRVEAVQRRMFRDYDPETARPKTRELHRAYWETASALIEAYRREVSGQAMGGAA
jgi:predicted GIY-YIG superfamily endonuclease